MPDNEQTNEVRLIADALPIAVCGECGCEIDVEGIEAFSEVECPDCSSRVRVSARLGQFILTELIGTGGMGGVYYGKDETLGRNVAVKVMLKSLGDNAEFVASFKREAQAAAKINHPNIVQIYSFGTERGQPYIVMELINGLHFDKLIEEGKALDQTLVMQVGLDIAEACNAANEQGLLHGDIKPENILLDEKLNAKLVDFGIASFANQSQEGIWGTPYYIAPEKLKRQKPDERSDMYSLGATLYHALIGRPPFEGKTPIEVVKARLDKNPVPLTSARKDINPGVAAVIMRMLNRNPAMRHPTYSSLIADFRKCLADLGGRRKSISSIKKTGRVRIGGKATQETPSQDIIPLKPAHNKIMIQKRTPGERDSSAAAYTPPGQTKIVMRKKPAVVLSHPKSQTDSKGRATGAPSAPPKPASNTPLIILLVLLSLGAIGSVIGYFVHKHRVEIARRQEMYRYEYATASLKAKYEELHQISTNLAVNIAYSTRYVLAVSNAVLVVLNEHMEIPVPKPKPVEDIPAATDTPPAATNAPATPATNAPPANVKAPAGKTVSFLQRQHHASPAHSTISFSASMNGRSGSAFHAAHTSIGHQNLIPSLATLSLQAIKDSATQLAWNSMHRFPVLLAQAEAKPADKGGSLRSKMGKNPKFPTRDDAPAPKVDEAGREAPEGLEESTPEPKKAAPEKETAKPAAEAPDAKPEKAAAAAPVKKSDPLAPDPADPEIKKLAKKVMADWATLLDKSQQIIDKDEEAGRKVDEAKNSGTSTGANAKIPQVIEILDWMKETGNEIKEISSRMKENAAKVDALKERHVKDIEDKRNQEAAAEQARKDEEAKQKKAEQLKALAAGEVQLATGTRESLVATIKQNKFAEVLKALEEQKKTMQTDDGKNAIQLYIDRAARLESLRMFLIQQMKAAPYPWGWIQDGAPTDIKSAADDGIKTKSRIVPWPDVTVRQWIHLFKNYLSNPLNTKNIAYKVHADQQLNAAIYCFENGGTEAAKEYIRDAVLTNPDIRPEAERLLRELID